MNRQIAGHKHRVHRLPQLVEEGENTLGSGSRPLPAVQVQIADMREHDREATLAHDTDETTT